MKKILKQALGIDVAQKELVVSLGRMHEDLSIEINAHKVFPNTKNGFSTLVSWVQKRVDPNIKVSYVMEATGVYHESLAYYLEQEECEVSIVLPNKISNYFRTLEVKTVTDKTASQTIARFGLERKLDLWKRPKPVFKKLRQLTRERDQIVQDRTMAKNQLHAEQAEAEPHRSSVNRIQKRITFLNKQEKEIQQEIAKMAKEDLEVSSSIGYIRSITGVGLLTTVTVLAETNGFELIRNKRQLTSYAGFDVKEKQSGTSVRGKARISKRGNRYLRKAMHLPALTAIKHSDRFKAIFVRLVSKHGIKMKAAVAVQRKLLEMIYTIYKTKTLYNEDYLKMRCEQTVTT
jgi:transposase